MTGRRTSRSPGAFLIETFAIRNRPKPSRINRFQISNRDILPLFSPQPASLRQASSRESLIGPPVSRLGLEDKENQPIQAQRRKVLIATPAIRICPKPFRISADFDSNRRKTPGRGRALGSKLPTSAVEPPIPNRNNSPTEIAVSHRKQRPIEILIATRNANSETAPPFRLAAR